MVVRADHEAHEKVKLYDKGVECIHGNSGPDPRVSYRTGDLWVPRVEHIEALSMETQYFVDCVLHNRTPFNDGRAGLRVVQMLEAVDRSMVQMGGLAYCYPTTRKAMSPRSSQRRAYTSPTAISARDA